MPAQLGKRYKCEVCATEVLCTRPSEEADLQCDDQPMALQEPQRLPQSD